MKNLSKYFLIFTATLTTSQALPVKRQTDDNPDTRPAVNDRYGFLGGDPGFFNQPFNPNNFGFNIFGSNPFLRQLYPQNQFFPQNQPIGNSISQPPPRVQQFPNQNQQFRPQNQQFQPQNQQTQQFQPQNQQNQQFQPQSQQNQQFQPQNQQTQQIQQQNQQTQQVVSTTVSPQVQACIDSCIESTAGQYNPVCGSNNMTYHNQERFECAVECGQNIRVSYRGACARPTIPSWQRQ